MKKLDRAIQSITCQVSSMRISDRVTLGQKKLSAQNAKLFNDALRAYGFLCEDIAIHHFCCPYDMLPTYKTFLVSWVDNDVIAVLDFFDSVRMFFVRTESTLSYRFLRSAIAALAVEYGVHNWKGLLSPIKGIMRAFCCEKALQPRYLQDISSFLLYAKKLPFVDIGVEEKMLGDYRAIEDKLNTLILDDSIVEGVTDVITKWFKGFKIDSYKPFHGNGSTALGKLTKYEKYHHLGVDSMLLRCLNVDASLTTEYFPVGMKHNLRRVSKLQFVPKTAKKLRSISMEEPSLIYFQQSVRVSIETYIKHHRILRNIIMFGNQTRNQDLAQMGSVVRNISTIDLSAASDSVSLKLVRRVFSGVPNLYRHLIALRSHSTLLPNGEIVRLAKYAPMGSALCFPVECIIFAAVVQYCYNNYHGIAKNLDSKFFAVYGDDIVCNDYITSDVIRSLEALGFSVNTEKSFFGNCLFRESCGREFFDGVEVTPVYYRLPPIQKEMKPEFLASLAGMTHTAMTHHYCALRAYFVRLALHRYKWIAFTASRYDTSLFLSNTATNFHLKKRDIERTRNYQADYRMYRTISSEPTSRRQDDDDQIRLFEWLLRHSGRSRSSWKTTLFPETVSETNLHGSSVRLSWGYAEVCV